MSSEGPPEWAGAVWVGALDVADLAGDGPLTVPDADGYETARFLVRDGRDVVGFVQVPITEAGVSRETLRDLVAALPTPVAEPEAPTPPISVVICTRNRTALLTQALESVLACDYPTFEVILVDNAGAEAETRALALNHPDPRVRFVSEPRPGVSRGRNRGLRAAAYDLVAFVDDDVVVDEAWLTGIAGGFARAADVALVCALVPTGEIRTRTQAWFDHRVTWGDARAARQYRLSDPPADLPLFPFQVGSYGTGASFAVKRSVYEEVGGLDVAMGPGTATMGGEDIDLFVRVLAAGRAIAVEPAAVVWHRHRDDLPALEKQAIGYGIGLGAWLTKTTFTPRLVRMAVPLLPAALARLRTIAQGGSDDPEVVDHDFGLPDGYTRRLGRLELRSALAGPFRYARAAVAALRN